MSTSATRSKNLSLLFWFAILVIAVLGVRWVIVNNRAPGSMTPIEAQAMDMTAMKSPPGVQPVGVETVGERSTAGQSAFPATVMALSDEDVVARIPGRVVEMPVYPGDSVRQGQLLARLEADEYATQAAQAQAAGQASLASVTVAEADLQRMRVVRDRMAIEVATMGTHLRRTNAMRAASGMEAQQMREELKAKESDAAERQADLTYADQSLERERRLHKAGAISLDELQEAQAKRDAAAARVATAGAEIGAAKKKVDAADKRVAVAEADVSEAMGHHESARKGVLEADRDIEKARAEIAAKQKEAKAMLSGAGTTNVIAGYRQLRALGSAVVSERLASPGSLVQPGQVVMKLKVVGKVRVQAQVPARFAGMVREGAKVEVAAGEIKRHGRVTSVFPTQDASTRTFIAEAILDNPDKSLQPGMYARMSITTGKSSNAIAVRDEAVQTDADGGHFVWIVSERQGGGDTDWTCTMHPEVSEAGPGKCPICHMDLTPRKQTGRFIAARKKVATGASDGVYTVIADGLKRGDKVIFAGFESLTEGAAVAPTPWGESGPESLPAGSGKSTHEGM